MQAPKPGEILLGKYRVEEIIGVGGMGRVVKAGHMYLQQPVAIKILLPEMADSQSTVARFLREAQATVRLRSEHIARVMDVGTMPDGSPFMVMEYLEGHDLNQILRHHGPQEPRAVVDLILQACEGMAEAHAQGIIHRDIKPSNFFITRRPDGSSLLKILDFGISKTPAELSELTGAQTVVGTPTYMAPEQMVSARSTDPRSDIWSIGVVMYQLLSGRPPFEAENYAQLVLKVGTAPPGPLQVGIPPGMQDIVFRCLEKDPNRRIQSVGELARMLAPYASDPMTAQQSAERSSRILTSPKGAQPGFPLAGSAGGLSLSPPALTPKSWNHGDTSSISGGAGQFGTKVVRKSQRAFVIAGVASLCIVAGVGGFFIASSMKDRPASAPAAEQPATTKHEMRAMPVVPAAGPTASGTVSGATTPTSPAKAENAKAAPAEETVTSNTKSDTAKSDTAKSEAVKSDAQADTKSDAKTEGRKTTAKSDATSTEKTRTKKSSDKSDEKIDAKKATRTTKSTKSTKSTKDTKSTKSTKSESSDDDLFDSRK